MLEERRNDEPWKEYRMLVISELERLNVSIIAMDKKLDIFKEGDLTNMKVKIAMLEVRCGIFGAIAGLIASGLIGYLSKR